MGRPKDLWTKLVLYDSLVLASNLDLIRLDSIDHWGSHRFGLHCLIDVQCRILRDFLLDFNYEKHKLFSWSN